MKTKYTLVLLSCLILLTFTACNNTSANSTVTTSSNSDSSVTKETPTLTLIGHSSVKIKSAEGDIIYIAPYAKGNYSEPADIVLVTHNHVDHNNIDLMMAILHMHYF